MHRRLTFKLTILIFNHYMQAAKAGTESMYVESFGYIQGSMEVQLRTKSLTCLAVLLGTDYPLCNYSKLEFFIT